MQEQSQRLPEVVAHADWGSNPDKRWMARATLQNGRYLLHKPEPVGEVSSLLTRLNAYADGGATIAGFDFPVGVPHRYAQQASISYFPSLLQELGSGSWSSFYEVAQRSEQIDVHRPFYPRNSPLKGSSKHQHLLDGLGVSSIDELLRRCDRRRSDRPAAAPIFWTLGPKQVGKAAISGWRDVLTPALRSPELDVAIWPFEGELFELLEPGRIVVAETYPAEFYRHLDIKLGSKRSREDRLQNAPTLLLWADRAGVELTTGMTETLVDGFGDSPEGEDPFDAAIGLFGMLNVILNRRPSGAPSDDEIRKVEGWMLGQLEESSPTQATENIAQTIPSAGPVSEMPKPEYEELADLYDVEHGHDYDLPLWLDLADREPGPVIEWGAGTGRIANALARTGHDVTAVELSGAMAARGRKKGEAQWITGDMRDVEPGREFGLAVCAFNSFLCLTSPDAALDFLANAATRLESGGLLGIEVSAFRPEELAVPPGGPALQHDLTRRIPDGGSLERFSISHYDPAGQLLSMRLFYELYDERNVMYERRSGALEIRTTTRDELILMLQLAGFTVEEVYGDFHGEPFTAGSDHLIVLARLGGKPLEA